MRAPSHPIALLAAAAFREEVWTEILDLWPNVPCKPISNQNHTRSTKLIACVRRKRLKKTRQLLVFKENASRKHINCLCSKKTTLNSLLVSPGWANFHPWEASNRALVLLLSVWRLPCNSNHKPVYSTSPLATGGSGILTLSGCYAINWVYGFKAEIPSHYAIITL